MRLLAPGGRTRGDVCDDDLVRSSARVGGEEVEKEKNKGVGNMRSRRGSLVKLIGPA